MTDPIKPVLEPTAQAFSDANAGDWVMTGSHNFNDTSLRRNDEAMIELSDRRVVKDYAANFARLWQAAPRA